MLSPMPFPYRPISASANITPGGILIPKDVDFKIDLQSVFDSTKYIQPVFNGGIPINPPCHIIMGEHVKGANKNLTIKELDSGWVYGVMMELYRNAEHEYGMALGRKTRDNPKIEWKIAVPARHYHLLEMGEFMDCFCPFVLAEFDIEDGRNSRTVLNKTLRWMSQERWRVHKFLKLIDAEHEEAGSILAVDRASGERFIMSRSVTGRITRR